MAPCSDGRERVIRENIFEADHLDGIPTFCGGAVLTRLKVLAGHSHGLEECAYDIASASYHLGVQTYENYIEVRVPSNFAHILKEEIAQQPCVDSIARLY